VTALSDAQRLVALHNVKNCADKLKRLGIPMGILADFFVATPQDALDYESRRGHHDELQGRYELFSAGRVTGLEIGVLWALLEGALAYPWTVLMELALTSVG
jgi:hypothetical protein